MKEYPKIDGKELDNISKKRFDNFEKIIKSYLDMDLNDTKEVMAYNLAFLLLTDDEDDLLPWERIMTEDEYNEFRKGLEENILSSITQ